MRQLSPCARRLGNPCDIHRFSWPSEPLALGFGIPQACFNPLRDQAPLEFRDGAENRKDHPPGWRRSVELLGQAHKLDAERLERL